VWKEGQNDVIKQGYKQKSVCWYTQHWSCNAVITNIQPHPKLVATLPCKIFMSKSSKLTTQSAGTVERRCRNIAELNSNVSLLPSPNVLVAVSKTLLPQNPPVLNWRCQLTLVHMHNGHKLVVYRWKHFLNWWKFGNVRGNKDDCPMHPRVIPLKDEKLPEILRMVGQQLL